MKLISVIVPAYNVENYIARCLDSIINQTYSNLEIIVVDDGSTDNTGAIIDDYAKKDTRIKAIHQQNAGVAVARNTGIENASGDYYGFVDSDDYIEPTMYSEMLNACETSGSEMAVTEYKEIGGDESISYSMKNYILSKEEALNTFVCENSSYRIQYSVWSRLCRKDIIKDLRFAPGKNCEDIMFSTKLMCAINSCVMLDKPLYNYTYDRTSSIMNTRLFTRRFDEELPYCRERIAYFSSLGMVDFQAKAQYYYYRRLLGYFSEFKNRKMKEACDKIISEIRQNKSVINDVYSSYFAKKGDISRMKLFLISPSLFYVVVKLYEKIIVPLKSSN